MNDPARLTDRELFEAITSGDPRALAELAGRHGRGLYDFALRGTLDEQQAETVLETVFQRVREPVTPVPPQIDFRTWLYSLCLIEVLAISNETRTARVSTEDERFYHRTSNVDPEIAHRAWQAARGLRTRDYCVLDLTLRRGLTPEEVAEAASLTRSNLYASIGRARGAFEEAFAAMMLFEHGREECNDLDEMVESAPGGSLRPALRYQIVEHAEDCDFCRHTLDSLPLAAAVYISLEDVAVPDSLARRILAGRAAPLEERSSDVLDEPPAVIPAAPSALPLGGVTLGTEGAQRARPEDLWSEREVSPVPEAVVPVPVIEPETGEDEEYIPDDVEEPAQEEEPEDAPVRTAIAGAPLLDRREPERASISQVREGIARERRPSLRERIAIWAGGSRGQPVMWTYALLGIAAVIAIYLGVAVADSLQSGGGDSGAVPLDSPPGAASEREIDCGEEPIEMQAGAPDTIVSFDQGALDGYQIRTLSFLPASGGAEIQDLEATVEDPFSIRFAAPEQEASQPRTEEFELNIQWVRGEEAATSTCRILVNVRP